MSELKPCPFCGGDQLDIGITGGATFWVECSSCGSCSASHDDEYDATTAWNNRPGEDALQERVEALEWLREVEEYAMEHEHPVCTAMGNSSKRGQLFDRAAKEYDSILSAAKAAVEKK